MVLSIVLLVVALCTILYLKLLRLSTLCVVIFSKKSDTRPSQQWNFPNETTHYYLFVRPWLFILPQYWYPTTIILVDHRISKLTVGRQPENLRMHERTMVRTDRRLDTSFQDARMVASSSHEEKLLYVQTCQRQLLIAASQNVISQTDFAGFVSRYCRDSVMRGPGCPKTSLIFQDLPLPLQLNFVGYKICSDVSQLECLRYLNANAALFYIGVDAIPTLCTSTFELMLSNNLLMNATATATNISDYGTKTPAASNSDSGTNTPISQSKSQTKSPVSHSNSGTKSPASAPTRGHTPNPSLIFSPLVDATLKNDTSLRGSTFNSANGNKPDSPPAAILGVTITSFVALLLLVKCLLCRVRRIKHVTEDPALQVDESITSENSQEFSPIVSHDAADQQSTEDDCSASSSSSSWFRITPKSASSNNSSIEIREKCISPRYSSSKSSKQKSSSAGCQDLSFETKNNLADSRTFSFDDIMQSPSPKFQPKLKRRFSYPLALGPAIISQDNPVHVRKRFGHRKGGSFSSDDDDCSRTADRTSAHRSTTRSLPLQHLETTPPPAVVNLAKLNSSQQFEKENSTMNYSTATADEALCQVARLPLQKRARDRGQQHVARNHQGLVDR